MITRAARETIELMIYTAAVTMDVSLLENLLISPGKHEHTLRGNTGVHWVTALRQQGGQEGARGVIPEPPWGSGVSHL